MNIKCPKVELGSIIVTGSLHLSWQKNCHWRTFKMWNPLDPEVWANKSHTDRSFELGSGVICCLESLCFVWNKCGLSRPMSTVWNGMLCHPSGWQELGFHVMKTARLSPNAGPKDETSSEKGLLVPLVWRKPRLCLCGLVCQCPVALEQTYRRRTASRTPAASLSWAAREHTGLKHWMERMQ